MQRGFWSEKMEIWLDSNNEKALPEWPPIRVLGLENSDVAEINLDDFRAQEEALSLIGSVPWLLVRCSNWTIIPLENLIAVSRGSGTKIAAAINSNAEINGAAFALEHGVDAILVQSEDLESAIKVADTRKSHSSSNAFSKLDLRFAKVTSIETSGLGERVCIDLTQRIEKGEGLAIGSSSNLLCLIHGETIPSEYVPSRPFRVNAGAIHSYVLMADGRTRYLSELNSGDSVAVISKDGSSRPASIGRLKIERRPMQTIRLEHQSSTSQIVVQYAETVRLVSRDGEAISITDIDEGTEVSILKGDGIRHVGLHLDGEMVER